MTRTSISIPIEVKKRLTGYGSMNDSYADVIVKLMDFYDNNQNMNDNNSVNIDDKLIDSIKKAIKEELIEDTDLIKAKKSRKRKSRKKQEESQSEFIINNDSKKIETKKINNKDSSIKVDNSLNQNKIKSNNSIDEGKTKNTKDKSKESSKNQ